METQLSQTPDPLELASTGPSPVLLASSGTEEDDAAAAAEEAGEGPAEANTYRGLVKQHSSHGQVRHPTSRGPRRPFCVRCLRPMVTPSYPPRSPAMQVARFVCLVLRHSVPLALFGTSQNRQRIFRHVERYLRLTQFATLSLDRVMQGFEITACSWACRESGARASVNAGDLAVRTSMVRAFVRWLFEDVITHLIRSHFYVTDTGAHKNRVFYFRKVGRGSGADASVQVTPPRSPRHHTVVLNVTVRHIFPARVACALGAHA